jgi:hypothetical protein
MEEQLLEKTLQLDEDLKQWFSKTHPKGNWKAFNTSGKSIGACGSRKKGEPYAACLGNKYAARLRAKGGRKAIANWVRKKLRAQRKAGHGKKGGGSTGRKPVRASYKEELNEVFSVKNKEGLKNDLIQFLRGEFQKGDLNYNHQGISTTEYKPDDWYEDMADNVVNRLIQYFQTTKGQTERDL